MFYLIRYVNTLERGPKNTWYKISNAAPRNTKTQEVLTDGFLGITKDVEAYAEGEFETFDLASQQIPDEYEDEGKGVFTDPRPIVRVLDWIKEDVADIKMMDESVLDEYIHDIEEDADVEGVILSGDLRACIANIRASKGQSSKK